MNHGATCYMNGLLQSLFHVGEFRKIVYAIDCEDTPDSPGKEDLPASQDSRGKGDKAADESEADGGKAPPLIHALQNVFYRLQTAEQAVNCRELMKSFGWDTMDAFTQHDAQELNRILCDRLEEQMKGSAMDGSIKRLFEGEMENYIECIDVDYKSRRNETFYDIQLNIKGERQQELKTIEESLREFTAEETLEGDNAYEAEGHGKQKAKKGIRFLTFPPVLNLQLKRFHFDLEKMEMVKLNTRFEFHRRLDLGAFAPGAGTYLLYGVVEQRALLRVHQTEPRELVQVRRRCRDALQRLRRRRGQLRRQRPGMLELLRSHPAGPADRGSEAPRPREDPQRVHARLRPGGLRARGAQVPGPVQDQHAHGRALRPGGPGGRAATA